MLHDRRRSKLVNRRWLAFVFVLIASVLAIGPGLLPRLVTAASPTPNDQAVTAAWEKARAAGSYHFNSDVTQVTVPVANVTNVGRSSRTEQLHLEGQTDLREKRLEMKLWSAGGSVLQGGGIAVKVENGQTFTRRGAGEWQEATGFADAIAPQGDFLAYLNAMRDIQAHAPEQRAGIALTRYSFTIDGPTFAAYVRDRMTEALRAKGELPAGVNLNASDYYGKMTGDGELWVGEDGLPLRQVLKLNFPAQNDEFVSAQIVVNFSRFGKGVLAPASTAQGLDAWLANFGLRTEDFGAVLALLTMTALVAIIFYYRRTRVLQTALAGAVILSMVLGPLLSTFQIDAFYATQAAQAATQEEQQATADTQRELSAALGAVEFNPQVNPVESTGSGIQDTGYGINNFQSLNLSTAQSPNLQTTDPGTNSDSDALTDFVEARVGTDPANPDTDEDGVNDAAEVLGFQLGGQTWYANPLELDSNNDGLADGQEWSNDGNSQPDDTDGDGIPDVFDPDNDNDTVPDRQDLSPFSAGAATYAEATPLRLTLNNLAVNKPTLVDFQVRPTDVNRLWYAFNVLDWPRDNGGQVQDVDGATYAELATSQGRTAAPNEADGDMKLIPMLEIRITGATTNLPLESELTPYNVSVNELTVDGSQKVVYVPLSIISSEQTGQRVAFSGRMKYLPSGSWPSPHDIRLAWVVQTLVDLPCDMDNPQAVAAGCVDGYIRNTPQVVQSYYDDWTLTGFNVSEQSGAKTALIYEDPAIDQNLSDDYPLTALSVGLDNSFLAGRNADNNNQRDVDINEIARRFDRLGNGTVSADQRWGLTTPTLNILRVERHDYTSFDQATSHTAMTDTVGLLNTQFNGAWSANNALKPTIMFAYEQQSRSLGLDAVRTAGGYITQSGANLTVNLQPSGQPAAALNTIVGLKWTRYCRPNSGSVWSPCANEVNWEELDSRYGHLPLSDDPPGAAVAAGSNALLQIYNLALSVGVDQIVQSDATIVADTFTYKTDAQTKTDVENGLNAGGAAVKKIANLVLMDRYLNNPRLRAKLGENVVAFVEGSRSRGLIRDLKGFRTNPQRATRVAVAAGVVLTGVAVGMYFLDNAAGTNNDARLALHTLLGSAQTYASLVDPALTAVRWVRSGNSVAQLLRSSSEAIGISRTANAIGAVIAISIVWGFFIYNVTSNDISTNSIEFGAALAQAIATTIYIIVLTILSATVVGLILVGIVTVIDVILTLVCEFGGGSCFSIGGTVIKALADAFYSYGLFISTSNKDLMLPGGPRTTLADPSKGFVAGNELGITMPITTHIIQQKPNSDILDKYGRFLTASLRATTFRYSLTQPNAQTVPNSGRETMQGDWRDVHLVQRSSKYTLYGAYAYTTPPSVAGFNLQAGLNRPANFYLNMGYAIPAYDCWRIYTLSGSFPFYKKIPICGERTIDGKNSSLISALRYDIFPNTLGGFLAMTTKTDTGRGLAWDAAFPSLKDADGDGLRANIHGGLDPDDTKWDADNDGLADGFELALRAAGTPYSPIQCDSDGDGLTDGQEEELRTNPANADSDNDGLGDGDEVWHRVYNTSTCQPTTNWSGGWNVTINANPPFSVRVASNPALEDSDGDGINDLAEKQLAQHSDPVQRVDNQDRPYHPNVVNTPPISVLTATNKRFVAPGQSLIYTTTVVANTAVVPGVLDYTTPTQLGATQAAASLPFDPLTFSTAQTVTRQINLTAQVGVNSQTVALGSTVRTRLPASGAAQTLWEIGNQQTLASIPQSVGTTHVAAMSANQTGNYLLNTNTRQSSGAAGGSGVVRVDAIPSGGSSVLYTATSPGTTMSTAPAGVACNASGLCIAVWDEQNNTTQPSTIRAAVVDANGQVVRSLTAGLGGFDNNAFGPVIASNGNGFLLFFETTRVNMTSGVLETYLARNQYDAATGEFATVTTTIATVQSPRTMARTQPSLEMTLVWMGDRYRLAWKVMGMTSIYASDFAADGATLGGSNGLSQTLLTSSASPNFAEGGPAMAYDPVTNRTVLVYATANGFLRRILWTGSNLTPALADGNLGPDENNPDNADLQSWFRAPIVAYNPTARGWVISKTIMRQVPNPIMGQIDFYMTLGLMLWKPDLSGRMIPDVITASNGPTGNAPVLPATPFEEMACQAPAALPVVDLRFEDLPAPSGHPTSFTDSSGHDNNTFNCSTVCPMAGAPGAVDSIGNPIGGGPLGPASDYAVAFRGTQDQFTIPRPFDFTQNSYSLAFWYKSPPSAQAQYLQMSVGLGYALLVVNVNGAPLFAAGDRQIFSGQNLNDNQWHYIVGSFNRGTNQLALYVDGVAPAVTPNGRSGFSQDPAQISVVSQRSAQLDGLQIYQSALSAADVAAIYNRTTQSYCVGTRLNNPPAWLKINLQQTDPRGGKITASGGMAVTIDADTPTSTLGGLVNNQFIRGNTVHTIGGNATDATSGVAKVEVNINNGGWQPATGTETWAYNLAAATGNYTVQTRATDAVGHVETPAAAITLRTDSAAPNVTLNAIQTTPIKPTRNAGGLWVTTLTGTVSDADSGVQVVEVLLQGQGDAVGNGWQTAIRNGNNWSLDYLFPAELTDPTGGYAVSVRAVDNVGNQTADNAASGILLLDATGPAVALSEAELERALITDTLTISGLITDTGTAGIDKLEIAFVTIEQIAALPVNATPAQADAALNRTWLPVTVVQRGAGVTQSTWSVQIPAGLENEYQIDLRATDLLGNVVQSTEAWRGVIDTLAPRVVVSGSRSAVSWFDPNSGQQMYDLALACAASDRYLNEPTFSCPAGGAPVRSFDNNPAIQALFPDRTILNGLTVSASYWWPDPNVAIAVSACDIYGHCASSSQPLPPAGGSQAASAPGTVNRAASASSAVGTVAELVEAGAPFALVVAPTAGSFVAADGDLAVTVAAEAGAALQTVTILLDNTVVQTLSFAQGENATRVLRTVSLAGVGEGPHTLVARATDWTNATQSSDYGITFTLDRQAPTVTIDPATLTNADTWAVGSGVLRFNGNASDSIGLAAVQIREGDGEFIDVTFGGGVWQTALPVTDPEGRTLNITVRAIDRAGRISEVTQSIGTDLSTASAPDTTIASGPTNPSNVNTATFEFTGGTTAVAFQCQLDTGEFVGCTSPWTVNGLSKGEHTLRVRAIDATGNVDLTPASFTWTVNASQLDATITASPANPSSSRDATFSFTGTGAGFECSLDGATFVVCTNPQTYTGLSYGSHTFEVRARDGSDQIGAAARHAWTIVNTAPVANDQAVSTNQNTAVAVILTANDVDALTYQVVSPPAHGVLVGTAPDLSYLPSTGFTGADSFTFRANDGRAESNLATVSINVIAVVTDNTPPTITPQVAGTAGSNGWYLSDVSLTWSVVDAESTVTSQTGCDPATVSTETAGQPFTCTATSSGGTATQASTIKLDKTAPETTITAQPSNPSNTASAAFQFNGTDSLSGPASFECSLDNGAFATCPSPQNYSALADGSHTFQVRTVDGAGNRDATPAAYTWTVQTMTVVATCGPITVYRNAQGQLVAPGWTGTIKLGTNGNNTIAGGSGRDLLIGLGGNDNLDGKAGDDLLCGGDGVDLVTGAAGNDVLEGGNGNDVLNGGAGDFDSLSGGDGNDVLLDGDGVINAQGGPGTDAFTIALRNGWRNQSGQPRFTGLAAGYGNDAVGLAILNTVRFFVDTTGDERDNPPSPLEGTNDAIVLVGLLDPTSTIIKFERRVGAARASAENEESLVSDEPISFEGFAVDPTTLTDESGAEFLTEPVGGDEPVEEVEQTEETIMNLFLPLINR